MIDNIISRVKAGKFVLIAEVGVNYYDIANKLKITPMEAAKLMIQEAANAGTHAVKFQTYKADTLASKDSPYYWDISEEPTETQHKLFQKFDHFEKQDYIELAQYAKNIGIEFLSTPFDIASADYLYSLMNVYKISSSDLNNLVFIDYLARKNKPIILSVGASNEDEIDAAVRCIRKVNDKPLILMHCVLEYPTPYKHANLNKIMSLKLKYPDLIVGYSDHTKPDSGYEILKTAYNLGATVIEKHFTLDKNLKGNDHYHAMDPKDVKKILNSIGYLDELRGSGDLKCLDSETIARKNARRSLVANDDIEKGEVITQDKLTFKRPGTGISVSQYENVLGLKASRYIRKDEILKTDMIVFANNEVAKLMKERK